VRALSPTHLSILDEIVSSEFGVSFNVLAERLKGKVSRVTLSREIKKLIKLRLIDVIPDPSHKQRLFYRARDEVKRLVEDFRVVKTSNIDQILTNMASLLRSYARKVKEIKNEALRDYMKYLILESLKESLILLEDENNG